MNKLKSKVSLTINLVLLVFVTIICSIIVMLILAFLLFQLPIVKTLFAEESSRNLKFFMPILVLILTSILVVLTISFFFSRMIVRPYERTLSIIDGISQGDFTQTLNVSGLPKELQELGSRFNRMIVDLNSIETLRVNFINDFSHEFKTPLAGIKAYVSLLQKPQTTVEQQATYLKIVADEIDRLTALSTSILQLSKVENTEIILDKRSILLDEQLRQSLLLLENKWELKKIQLHLELDEVTITCSEELLQQLWLNLLENAIKFSHLGGIIHLTLKQVLDKIEVVIQDEGIGMSEQTVKHIYTKFYQGDSSHTGEGNGLGMALVHRIVALHNGEIRIDSQLTLGTTIHVSFPIQTQKPLLI